MLLYRERFTPPFVESIELKRRAGFTLMEVLVATVLISVVLVALANLFVVGKRYILHARARTSAGQLGKFFLDPLQMQVRQDQWNSNCVSAIGTNTNCGTETTIQLVAPLSYTPIYEKSQVYDPNGQDTGLRRVKVTINWNEPT